MTDILERVLVDHDFPITRSDLIFIHRALDQIRAEVEGEVKDGNIDGGIFSDVEEAQDMIEQWLNDERD
jgi:hypothetical protein